MRTITGHPTSKRETNFLYRYLKINDDLFRANYPETYISQDEAIQKLEAFIIKYGKAAKQIYECRQLFDKHAIEDGWLKFLKEDSRALIYFADEFFQKYPTNGLFIERRTAADYFEHVVTCLDCNKLKKDIKVEFIKKLQREWVQCKAPIEHTYWIDPKNQIQIKWIEQYLIKNKLDSKYPSFFTPTNLNELFLWNLSILDKYHAINNYSESYGVWETFRRRIKKSWEQKKYRMSQDRRNLSVKVSKEAYAALKEMAKHEKLSKGAFLDGLIHQEIMKRSINNNYYWQNTVRNQKTYSLEIQSTGIWGRPQTVIKSQNNAISTIKLDEIPEDN